MRAVVIGTDEDGDVLACGALHQRAAHRRPGGEQALGVGGQRGPDLVPRAGQVPQQDLLVVEPAPAVEVALLPGLAPQAAPYHAVPDPELARQRRPCGGMPEGVGRVQDVEPAAQPLRVGGPEQQIPHQPFARRDLLVGEYVPRPHL